jgi:phospholipase/lecithinase/hemolysin
MTKNIKYSLYGFATAALFVSACKPNLTANKVTSGSADFGNYVAIGNSLCAGYTDGALSREGQENSFPRMLSQQFALATGANKLTTPFMLASGKGNNGSNVAALQLSLNPDGTTLIAPSTDTTTLKDRATIAAAGPYTHLGIPGARAIDLQQPFLALNPFFERLCETPFSSTLVGEALRSNPSFFTLWLGSNDVLLYAIDGASGTIQQAPTDLSFPGTLSHPAAVAGAIESAVKELTKKGAKGAIANVPDVNSTPYFTTIPYNAIALTRQGQVDSLNGGYATYNASVPAANRITWKLGANPIVIVDSTAPGFMRQTNSKDLICLKASAVLGKSPLGTITPLTDQYVLDAEEVELIKQYTAQYNASIKATAVQYGLAFVDANAYLRSFQSGVKYNGVNIAPALVTGGGFSLDGIHPTPRGYALIANEFIKSINSTYGSTIPMVDVNKYRTTVLP